MNRESVEQAEARLVALAAIGAVIDPVPDAAFETAIASLGWRTIDGELAALMFDSAANDQELVGIRSEAVSRQLTFEAPDLVIELEVDDRAGNPLVGQLVPPGSAEIEIRSLHGSVTVEADERGRFWARPLPDRLLSLRIRRPSTGGGWVATPWVALLPPSQED